MGRSRKQVAGWNGPLPIAEGDSGHGTAQKEWKWNNSWIRERFVAPNIEQTIMFFYSTCTWFYAFRVPHSDPFKVLLRVLVNRNGSDISDDTILPTLTGWWSDTFWKYKCRPWFCWTGTSSPSTSTLVPPFPPEWRSSPRIGILSTSTQWTWCWWLQPGFWEQHQICQNSIHIAWSLSQNGYFCFRRSIIHLGINCKRCSCVLVFTDNDCSIFLPDCLFFEWAADLNWGTPILGHDKGTSNAIVESVLR